jgi:hypothetical protein
MIDTSKISKHVNPYFISEFLEQRRILMKCEFKDAASITFHLKLPCKSYYIEHRTDLSEINSIFDGTYAPNRNNLKFIIDFLEHTSQKISTEHTKHLNHANIIHFITNITKFSKYRNLMLGVSKNERVFKVNIPINGLNMFGITTIRVFRNRETLAYYFGSDSDTIGYLIIRIISEDHLIISYKNEKSCNSFNIFINTTSFANLLKENFQ